MDKKLIIAVLAYVATWIPAFAGMTLLCVATPSFAADARKGHEEDLQRIQEYMSGITTIQADFTQVAPDGSLASGKFFLKRPGKMRWQYNPPTPILMIADGWQLVYFDYELQQVSYIPLNSSIATFLARKNIDLNDPFITITGFKKAADMIRLTLKQTDKPEAGKLMLEFSDNPLQIRNIVTTDAQGQVTTVALNNAQFGLPLDDKLFIFVDPRKPRH